ncbi:hypothetical protein AAC387_Pa01g0981 [Persea americana]
MESGWISRRSDALWALGRAGGVDVRAIFPGIPNAALSHKLRRRGEDVSRNTNLTPLNQYPGGSHLLNPLTIRHTGGPPPLSFQWRKRAILRSGHHAFDG